ncbi:hypothetical protein ACKVMT_08875 [Halobacteriales archaeon Cl-PHB]
MPDDKRGRDKQARDTKRRQRERYLAEELERRDETEPPVDDSKLQWFAEELDALSFPATGSDVVAAVGDREVEAPEDTYAVADLLPDSTAETFDSPDSVRIRIQRPTVATAMKRIVEASETIRNESLEAGQRHAYEKTFRELAAIDAVDEDEGIRVVADWVVDRMRSDQEIPGSRAVRREAAAFCRENGYEVRNDEWLGV